MKRKAGNACEGWGLERGPKGLLHRVKDVLPCMMVLAQGGCVKVGIKLRALPRHCVHSNQRMAKALSGLAGPPGPS